MNSTYAVHTYYRDGYVCSTHVITSETEGKHTYTITRYKCDNHSYDGTYKNHTYDEFKDYYCETHDVANTTSNSHTYNDPCKHTQTSLHFPN